MFLFGRLSKKPIPKPVTNYYRIVLGPKSAHLQDCLDKGLVGINYGIHEDLTPTVAKGEEVFRSSVRDRFLELNPEKSRPSGALAAGSLWALTAGMEIGDIVLVSDGQGASGKGGYHVARVTGGYRYEASSELPHQRKVEWLDKHVLRQDMSETLRNSSGSVLSIVNLTPNHAEEITLLLQDGAGDETNEPSLIAEAASFVLEKHLEDFLVANWAQTELAVKYDIVTDDDGEIIGQQYPTDTGPIDILAIAKDGSGYLVVELKRAKASDAVVGQIQRYMGFVKAEIATPGQTVRGAIVALEPDLRLERALSVAPDIEFYRYEVRFRLYQG